MILPYNHIKRPTDEIVKYIDGRRSGAIKSLRTRWKKFNRQFLGGIEPNVIISIAGISGSGKSSFVNTLETDLIDLNQHIQVCVLSFSFEMLSAQQIGRKLSYKMKKTTKELYSAFEKLSEDDLKKVREIKSQIEKYPIYYVDRPGTVDDIAETIDHFQQKCIKEHKWLVVILDHTLLTKGKQGDSERAILSDLQRMFIEKKKVGKTVIIQVTQMNRDIESVERINNPTMHYPLRKDIFGSDSIYQASDYVIVIHRPEILGIVEYGSGKKTMKTHGMIFLHFLKVREGEPRILLFTNNLKYNSIEEFNPLKT